MKRLFWIVLIFALAGSSAEARKRWIPKAPAGGGGASITAVTEMTRATNDTTIGSCAVTQTVTAGRAYFVFMKTETASPTTITMSGANSGTMTAGNLLTNGILYGRWWSVTSMASSGSTTFTPASGGTAEYNRLWLIEVTYSGGTASIDVNPSTGTGTSATATTATFSTAQNVEIVLAGASYDAGKTFTSQTIAGSAATKFTDYGDCTCYYRTLTSTVSSQTGSIAAGSSSIYCAPVISMQVL